MRERNGSLRSKLWAMMIDVGLMKLSTVHMLSEKAMFSISISSILFLLFLEINSKPARSSKEISIFQRCVVIQLRVRNDAAYSNLSRITDFESQRIDLPVALTECCWLADSSGQQVSKQTAVKANDLFLWCGKGRTTRWTEFNVNQRWIHVEMQFIGGWWTVGWSMMHFMNIVGIPNTRSTLLGPHILTNVCTGIRLYYLILILTTLNAFSNFL